MNITENFIDIINDYVSRNEMSYHKFIEQLGVSGNNIYSILQNRTSPSMQTIILVANVLKYSLDYMLGVSETAEFTPSRGGETFAERFELRRKELRLKKTDIAETLKLGTSAVSKWTRGKLPKPDTVIKLCDILKCSADYLFARSDS
ncbi:MAG: hypothetical protein DBX59_08250 [Bacillota bacterium]|nr:MAG: hypothetical protein DBX59_08250 [Bacillota bacterium]